MSNFVKYGDYLMLMGTSSVSDSFNKSSGRGYIQALGGIDINVYYHEINIGRIFGEENDWKELLETENESIFRIIPRLENKMHSQYKKLESRIRFEKSQRLSFELSEKLSKGKKLMEEEKSHNENLLKKKIGKELHFGDEVQLYHANSKACMVVQKTPISKSCYGVGLEQWPVKEAVFILMPCYKIHHEGDLIQYKTLVVFYNLKKKAFLSVSASSSSEDSQEKNQLAEPEAESLHPKVRFRKNCSAICRKKVILKANECDFLWQMLESRENSSENEDAIRGNDIVMLQHTETQAYLTADCQDQQSRVFLRKSNESFELETTSVSSLWEIQILSASSQERSGIIKTDNDSLLIRNYFTGEVLAVSSAGTLDCLRFNPNSRDSFAKFRFSGKSQGKKRSIMNNESYCLVSSETKQTVTSSGFTEKSSPVDFHQQISFDDPLDTFSCTYFKPIPPQNEGTTHFLLNLEDENLVYLEDAFKIERVSPDSMEPLFFLESCRNSLVKVIHIIKFGLMSFLPPNLLSELSSVLTKLTAFVLGIRPEDYQCLLSYQPIPNRQKLCKDMRMIEFLIDLVHLPIESGMYELDQISNHPQVQKCLREAFTLLTYIVNSYRPNEIYASQWLSLFIHQSLASHGANSIGAQEMLISLIGNNMILLGNLEPKIIKAIVGMLKQGIQNEVYIKLINSLVICDGKPIEKNQEAVSSYLFEENIYREYIHFNVRLNRYKDAELVLDGEYIVLREFKTVTSSRKDSRYNFFKESIEMLASLSMGRNFKAILAIRKYFTFELCLVIIQDRFLEYAMRSAFLRLVFYVFIDDSVTKVIYPHYLRYYDHSSREFVLEPHQGKEDQETEKNKVIKKFVLHHLEAEAGKGYIRAFNTELNTFLSQILIVIKKLVDFGSFGSSWEIERLYSQLLQLLDGSTDITTKEEEEQHHPNDSSESRYAVFPKLRSIKNLFNSFFGSKNERLVSRYQNTPENSLVVQIKLHIIKIIQKLDKIKMDMQITVFLECFQEYHPSNLFHAKNKPTFMKRKDMNRLKSFLPPGFPLEPSSSKKPITWFAAALANYSVEARNHLMAVLLDLILYENDQLTQKAFLFFEKQFLKSSIFLNCLKNVYIVEDEEDFNSLFDLNVLSRNLLTQAQRCEVWALTNENEKWIDTLAKLHVVLRGAESKEAGFEEPPTSMNKVTMELPHPECGAFAPRRISQNYEVYLIKREIMFYSRDLTRLFLFKKGEKGLLNFLNFVPTQKKAPPVSFHMCQLATLNTLTMLCLLNQQVHFTLLEHMPEILRLVDSPVEINAHLLLREVIHNKPTILDLELVKKIMEKVLNQANASIFKSIPRAASLLSSLDVCLKYKENSQKHNQTTFMTLLTQRPALIYWPNDEDMMTKITETIKTQKKQYGYWLENGGQVDGEKYFEINPHIAYFGTLLSLINLSCEGLNGATESIAKNIYSIKDLIRLTKISDTYPFLKYHLWGYFYHCYFDIEKKIENLVENDELSAFMQFLPKELDGVCEFLIRWVNQFEMVDSSFVIDHKGKKLLKDFYIGYLVEHLLPIMVEGSLVRFFISDSGDFLEFASAVFDPLKKLREKLPSTESFLMGELKRSITQLFENIPALMELMPRTLSHEDFRTFIKRGRPKEGRESSVLIRHRRRAPNIRTTIFRKSVIGVLKLVNLELEYPADKKSLPVSALISKEKCELIKTIWGIEKLCSSVFEGKVKIGINDILKGMLNVYKNSRNPMMINSISKLFRGVIEEAVGIQEQREEGRTIADIPVEEIGEKMDQLKEIQKSLEDAGAIETLIGAFVRCSKRKTREEILIVLIGILKGGNNKAQKMLYSILSQDQSNEFCRTLFKMMKSVIKDLKKCMKDSLRKYENNYFIEKTKLIRMQTLKESQTNIRVTRQATRSSSKSEVWPQRDEYLSINRSSIGPMEGEESIDILISEEEPEVSGYDEVSLPTEGDLKDSMSVKKIVENAEHPDYFSPTELVLFGSRIFKFLFHLCEGHFRPLQDFVREQTINGTIHLQAVNFLTLTVEAFVAFSKYINTDCLEFGENLIEFLIQTIQGPSEKNQMALCSLKIIEAVQALLLCFPKSQDTKSLLAKRGVFQDSQRKKISFILNRCIGLVTGLIEGSDSPFITKYFENTLNVSFLMEKMTQEFQHYKSKVLMVKNLKMNEIMGKTMKMETFDSRLTQAFNIYILFSYLSKNSTKMKENIIEIIQKSNQTTQKAYEFFQINTGKIEVILDNGRLFPYFFPVHPICGSLSEEKKKELVRSIPRSTIFEKEKVRHSVFESDWLGFDDLVELMA